LGVGVGVFDISGLKDERGEVSENLGQKKTANNAKRIGIINNFFIINDIKA
jgi:hypothetical protein